MAEKKVLTRKFEYELHSLPIELVPPDPFGPNHGRKPNQAGEPDNQLLGVEPERRVVDKLIDRIKRL